MATETLPIEGLPHQYAFWSDLTNGAKIALIGPLGTGKTWSLVIKDFLLHQYNTHHARRGFTSMMVEPTFGMTQDILIPAYEKVIMQELGIPIRIGGGQRPHVIWPPAMGRAKTLLRSAEKPHRLVGPNLSHVGFDEPGLMHFDAWKKGSVRARDPDAVVRQAFVAGTPEGLGWVAEKWKQPVAPYRRIQAMHWHPTMAHYPKEIATTFAGSPPQLDAYLRGLFVPMYEGRVYGAFDRNVHCVARAPAELYDPALPLILSCDFNVDAMRWLVCQVNEMAREIVILDEIALGAGGSVVEGAQEFISRYSHLNEQAEVVRHHGELRVTGDASGRARSQSTGEAVYDRLVAELSAVWPDLILDVPAANPNVRSTVETVNHHLSGQGSLVMIAETCEELVQDLEENTWKPGTTQIDKKATPPANKRTHAGDALRYLCYSQTPIRLPSRTTETLPSDVPDEHTDRLMEDYF